MNLAIIPARGGSKRIPRKNIRPFHGRPILAYPIEAALASGCFAEVMVSTEDEAIAAAARSAGAAVPFFRSQENAGDRAGTEDVVIEVFERYAALGRRFEHVCCLYPTAALATPQQLREGLATLRADPSLTAVVPVLRFGYPVQRALRHRNGRLPLMYPEFYDSRSQDLEPAFHDAGQWYWLRMDKFLASKELVGPNCAGIVLPEMAAQDMDNEDDWKLAEMKYALRPGHAK